MKKSIVFFKYRLKAVLAKGEGFDVYNIQLQNQMMNLGKQVEAEIRQLNSRMESYTTERKRLMGRQLVCCSDGTMSVVQIMSDGSQTSIPFITSTIGACVIADLFVDVISPWADYCVLEFESAAIRIVGNKKKFSEKWLYEEFVKCGIRFNPNLSKGFVMRILFETFAQAIENPPRKIVINSKAGWDAGVFRDFANYPLKTPDYYRLPVYSKSFCRREATEKDYTAYFHELRQITRWEDRVMLLIPLYMGLVASLLNNAGMATCYCWNLVMMEEMPSSQLAGWLQIYNRNNWQVHDADISTKKLNALLMDSKDEVLIMDFRSIPTESSYKIQKKLNLFWKIRNKIQLESVPLVFAAISDTVALGSKIFNIFLDKDFFSGDMAEICSGAHNELDAIMADFVRYIEMNFAQINEMLLEKGRSCCGDLTELEVVWNLLCKFFNERNYSLYEELGIPENFTWNALAEMSEWEEEELLELFARKFRRAVEDLYFKEKRYGEEIDVESTILYDTEYLWVPVNIWKRILEETGLDSYKHRILMELKEGSYMKADATGYSKKIHAGNQSHEVYQISKNIFNRPGYSDVTSCGKEE